MIERRAVHRKVTRTGGTITQNGTSLSVTNGMVGGSNRQNDVGGVTVVTNAAGDITSLLGKTLAYDAAGQLAEATAVPPCPTGTNCQSAQTTLSRFNGWGQRYLRETPATQSVFSYGMEGHNLLSETTRNLSTSALSTTEHIYLPTASGPMPVAVVIGGVHYAVHADHLNTPRRLSDANKVVKWQWPYSGFGEIAPQATPATGQAAISYGLRYPGQIDDGNGLFYNWNRFYDPRVGRYTSADPIGLEGGWNRFGYVDANPLGFVDPKGLAVVCFYSGGVGHTGVGGGNDINGATWGFYSRNYEPFGPGELRPDTEHPHKECTVIPTNPDQDACLEKCRGERHSNPGLYNLITRQCTSYVRDCLKECGLPSGSGGPAPEPWFRTLPGAQPTPKPVHK